MIYLCFDTNIYIKLLLDNFKDKSFFAPASDDTNSIILELEALTESDYYKILLPEVVELEIAKQNNNIAEDIIKNCSALNVTIEDAKKKIWGENHDLISQLMNTIDTYKETKLHVWKKYYQQLIKLFSNPSIIKLNLTPEIICETEKRKIMGLITEKQINDLYIIDTLYCFMNKCITNDDKVYLVSFDNGFFEKNKLKEKYKHKDFDIHVIYGIKQFEKQLNLKLIDDNLHDQQQRNNSNKSDIFYDIDYESDEFLEKVAQEDMKYICEMVTSFETNVLKQSDAVQIIRKELIERISKKLEKCRMLDSWDDRSELKLYQWLECRSENELPLSSISELILISKNVEEYYDIHVSI